MLLWKAAYSPLATCVVMWVCVHRWNRKSARIWLENTLAVFSMLKASKITIAIFCIYTDQKKISSCPFAGNADIQRTKKGRPTTGFRHIKQRTIIYFLPSLLEMRWRLHWTELWHVHTELGPSYTSDHIPKSTDGTALGFLLRKT